MTCENLLTPDTPAAAKPKRVRKSIKDGPLKAYKVLETCESTGGIVFANCNAAARRIGASEYNGGDWDGLECSRASQFDRYAPGPVPDIALWRAGWWFECACGRRIDDDFDYDHDTDKKRAGVADEPLTYRGSLYCSRWCIQHEAERRANTRAEERMSCYVARLALPPECVIERGYKNSVWRPIKDEGPRWRWKNEHYDVWTAKFTFPGGQWPATFEREHGTGFDRPLSKGEISVCNGDLSAWYRFCGLTPTADEIKHHAPYFDSFLPP